MHDSDKLTYLFYIWQIKNLTIFFLSKMKNINISKNSVNPKRYTSFSDSVPKITLRLLKYLRLYKKIFFVGQCNSAWLQCDSIVEVTL